MRDMNADDLRAWMTAHSYNVAELARDARVTPRSVQRYLSGDRSISPTFELALEALERRAEA